MSAKKETQKLVPEAQVKFWDTTRGKTLRAGLYLALSTFVSYAITQTTQNPELFGPMTVVVNLALVAVKNYLDPEVKN